MATHAFRTSLLIGGSWRESSDGLRFPVDSPYSQETIASVADASVADAGSALDAAWAARGFARWAPRERAEILRRCYELMMARKEELAATMVMESGKTIADARGEVDYAAEYFRFFSEEAPRILGTSNIAPAGAHQIVVEYEPVGIAVLVTPWNFPAAMAARKIAPAIAAGCTSILKPASETPLTALALGEIIAEAGAPAGVVNILPTARSADVVAALLADSRVRKLSFTGSTKVGQLLLRLAAANVLNCSMELGGNAPFILLADADIDDAVSGAMIAKFRTNGQTCTAANRFLVHRSIKDAFVAAFAARIATLQLGDPMDAATGLGPLITDAAVGKVEGLVRDAEDRGAKVVTGGHRLNVPGRFYPATLIDDVPHNARMLSEEIFGPVAPIVTFEDEADLIARANNTPYGLVSYVYSRNVGHARRVGRALESGMVALNRGLVSDPAAPFGGMKHSGLGREGSQAGLHAYLETKYYSIRL